MLRLFFFINVLNWEDFSLLLVRKHNNTIIYTINAIYQDETYVYISSEKSRSYKTINIDISRIKIKKYNYTCIVFNFHDSVWKINIRHCRKMKIIKLNTIASDK